ncbi:PREDICTED: putative speedy protein E8-like [Elephantulus edwardii]|uniref:putative speedy protein E8-like n=1 Tax=Elephantulus edwardii TaxID=28737 RepID=UPI0003F08F91|nr:PREDICTED: putative speedy protein E8-like [Elephantulus edwardii]
MFLLCTRRRSQIDRKSPGFLVQVRGRRSPHAESLRKFLSKSWRHQLWVPGQHTGHTPSVSPARSPGRVLGKHRGTNVATPNANLGTNFCEITEIITTSLEGKTNGVMSLMEEGKGPGILATIEPHTTGDHTLAQPDRRPESSAEVSSRQKGAWEELSSDQKSSFFQTKKAPGNKSPLVPSSASAKIVPEQRTKRKWWQKRKRLTDIKAATSQLKFCNKKGQKRNMWTVNYVEGTKLRMNKRRWPSYRPEDQEAFYRLLEDPVIQSFLEADIFLKVSDKYLLSMVVEYFGRVGLPGHLYNRIHFFLALYIASDMEEDNPTSKRSIFQFLLGKEHWADLYKDFLRLKVEFFHAMGHRAWVTPELCEEIQAQNPHHWVWSRARQGAA